jgi:putative salt-induced outer membrane protein
MYKTLLISLTASSLLFSTETITPLKTHSELSFVNASGNSDNTSFAFELKADKNYGKHEFRGEAYAYYSEETDVETKNKWLLELNYDYMISQKFSFNYLIGYKQDKFSGFDSQFYTGPGLGYKAMETPVHKLSIQGNLLYSIDDVEGSDDTDDYIGYGAGFNYEWQILETMKFKQDLKYRSSFDDHSNYFMTSKSAVETKISDIFSMGFSYAIDYAHLPAETKESTDRTVMASLIIDY